MKSEKIFDSITEIDEKYIEQYGNTKAKVSLSLLTESKKENGKLTMIDEKRMNYYLSAVKSERKNLANYALLVHKHLYCRT